MSDACVMCGKEADRDLRGDDSVCSSGCEEKYCSQFCACGCGANVAEGEDCMSYVPHALREQL